MAGFQAIQGVDDTLRELAKRAVLTLSPKPRITVGSLDNDADDLRLNWFLYRVSPNPAYRNMEPPATGWHTARGRPPLALRLSYLLTAYPDKANGGGDQEQFAHAGIAAVMRELHEHAIIGAGEPALSPLAQPLVEPLRIAMEDLDVEAITKLWSAATVPLRLSIGYEISLVTVDPQEPYSAGPPVQTRHVAVAPSLGARLLSVAPARASFGSELTITATSAAVFTLAREPGDPVGAGDWPLTAVNGHFELPSAELAPGARRILTAHDAIGITLVPLVTGPATVARGVPVTLATAHAAPDVEAFLSGLPIPAQYVSPTAVTVTIPSATAPGPAELLLRAGKVAGPPTTIEVTP